ncbi:MAG: hypothetical protein GY697_03730 [Desulfobacterales bacterium]|nr:hypothetical protein [Desulfobacterales bacterium]
MQPHLGLVLDKEELENITWKEKLSLLRAGIMPQIMFPGIALRLPEWYFHR